MEEVEEEAVVGQELEVTFCWLLLCRRADAGCSVRFQEALEAFEAS